MFGPRALVGVLAGEDSMDLGALMALAAATAVLAVIPGPNMAFFLATTLERGRIAGFAAILGTSVGLACQLALVVSGLAVMLEHAAGALSLLKWLGAGYLVVMGVVSWRRGLAPDVASRASRAPYGRLIGQGVGLALLNPKTLMFLAAFLPQFLPREAELGQVVAVAAVYLGVLPGVECLLVAGAGALRVVLGGMIRLRYRLTGGLFVLSGVGLALARTDR